MNAPSENELLREGKRIMRKLIGGAILKRLPDGSFAVMRRAQKIADVRTRAPAGLVQAMCARGLLEAREGGVFVAGDAGKGWYLRLCAAADPFAAQHQLLTTTTITGRDGRKLHVTVNAAESPLTILRQRGLIGAVECDAGERLRCDYTLAQLMPRMGVDLSATCTGGKRAAVQAYLPETVLAAKQRFIAAMRAAGPGLTDILFDVCCDLRGLDESEKSHGWPRSSAKVVLRIALNRLARHYGMDQSVSHAPTRGWIREENPPP